MEIEIRVNDKPTKVPKNASLALALSSLAVKAERGIAVAVNGIVVPKDNWKEHQIQPNDSVLIITATQGG